MDVWGFKRMNEYVRIWEESVNKMNLFELRYARVDLWEKFTEIWGWCDDNEKFFNIFRRCKI